MIFKIIADRIVKPDYYFVFPSQAAAVQWSRKICVHGPLRSVAEDRFMAWDRFKESVLCRSRESRPASSLVRKLFAHSLVRANAEQPFLSAVIPPEFAADGAVFSNYLASLLPLLAYWEAAVEKGSYQKDEEDRDLGLVKTKYAHFLRQHRLFEPAWEHASAEGVAAALKEAGRRYLVFFPEALSDFLEYKKLLDCPEVELILADKNAAFCREHCSGGEDSLYFFNSSREEIKAVVERLLDLRRGGIPFEDMAVSLGDFNSMEPYFTRECFLRGIPFYSHMGRPLGEYPAGRLFSLLNKCIVNDFSFDALKTLLLDTSIPWRFSQKNTALVDFGILNHCVSSYRNSSGKTVDSWNEALEKNGREPGLREYYNTLREKTAALGGAKSFLQLRDAYFAFRGLLNMDDCGEESDAVLAREIAELSLLVQTETQYPDLAPPNPLAFFCSHLDEKNYVYNRRAGGVNIFDYRVAAGTPFRCHFVLNASQAAVTVQYRPLPFLSQDKRELLGIKDSDESAAMLSLYHLAPYTDYSCLTWTSASERTFSGWAIPHSTLALKQSSVEHGQTEKEPDPYRAEKNWRSGGQLPAFLYPLQKSGFSAWTEILLARENGAEHSGGGTISAAVRAELKSRVWNRGYKEAAAGLPLSVSATDLGEFFSCPLSWLYKRIFGLEPYKLDAAMLDDESRGLLYHDILRLLFTRIKERGVFKKSSLGEYVKWAGECTALVLRTSRELRGQLLYPLIPSLSASMTRRLRALLATEARYLNGYEVLSLEEEYSFLYREGILLKGRIDRVSRSDRGPLIIDYKTSKTPSLKNCRAGSEDSPLDYQMPMYIKLYEQASGERVTQALYANITKHKLSAVIGTLEGTKNQINRDEYDGTMEALDRAIDCFAARLEALDFTPEIVKKICANCSFKTICRSLYDLNPGPEGQNKNPVKSGFASADEEEEEDND
ncbi:MAG: PD-(D/E)XK nuclease family protein [Treponema sp.]|jgi:RecB family exonuclease|nr:PD-(D/E)XK nuclease family protein [Treponema sp.]